MPSKTKTRLNSPNDDGWISANETWTYASATTINVPAGALLRFGKGDKLKMTQDDIIKYFYIINVSDTLLTIYSGNDYTLVNSVISNIFYSHISNPIGFPDLFTFTPNLSNITKGSGGTLIGRLRIKGKIVELQCNFIFGTGSSVGSGIIFTYPLLAANTLAIPNVRILDSGTAGFLCGSLYASTSSVELMVGYAGGTFDSLSSISSAVPMTWANGDTLWINVNYEIA